MSLTEEDAAKFAETVFVVEANGFEQLSLWTENERNANRVEWKQECQGFWIEIGQVDERPICISINWALLNGKRIAFWYGCSQLVDHKMINEWWEKTCAPKWDGGARLAHTNAMNFGHAIRAVLE